MSNTTVPPLAYIATTVEPYDHQMGGDFPAIRGVVVSAERPYAPGIAYSRSFPDVYIDDVGGVEFAGYRVPLESLIAWMHAVEAQIRARHLQTAPSSHAAAQREGAAADVAPTASAAPTTGAAS